MGRKAETEQRGRAAEEGVRLRADPADSMEFDRLPALESVIAGRYRIGQLVGRGSFAHVYRATHVTVPSIVYAVKVLRKSASQDASLRERFRLEAEAAASLRSPHVAPVIDFGETEAGLPFLVMPLLEGLSADRLLRQVGLLRPADVARFSLDVLDALEVAHAHGIIHRDLKPSNIFIERAPAGRHPTAKVLDFGIAKLLEDSSIASVVATALNSFVGTPAFASPEALAGEPDPRGDLYALGHSMANLLDGYAPYERERTQALAIQRHLSDEPVPFGPQTEACELCDIVARACAKRPDDRFQSALEMARAIRATGLAQLDMEPLQFHTDMPPWRAPSDEQPTAWDRPSTPLQDSATAERVGLASTLARIGVESNGESEAGPGDTPVSRELFGRAQRRWVPWITVVALVGVIWLVWLLVGRGAPGGPEGSDSAERTPTHETAEAPSGGSPTDSTPAAPTGTPPTPESPARGDGDDLAALAGVDNRPVPEEVVAEPALRRASALVGRASRVELDNLVDLASSVEGVEAFLGDQRLGPLPLRGAYVPRTRPLTIRFVGRDFVETQTIERGGPVVIRFEPPPRRRRSRAENTDDDGQAVAHEDQAQNGVASDATAETPGPDPLPADGESDDLLFEPPQTDLRNPFE